MKLTIILGFWVIYSVWASLCLARAAGRGVPRRGEGGEGKSLLALNPKLFLA